MTDSLQPIDRRRVGRARQRRPATNGDSARRGRRRALAALDSGKARVAEQVDGAWTVNQWLKKAVLLSFRLNPMEPIAGGPGGAHWWDKVPSKFAGWGEKRFRRRRLPRGPRRDRPPRRLCRARRGADAELRQHRRLRRRRRDDRYLGDGRQLRPDRPQRPYLGRRRHRRRARTAPGRPGDHRGRLLHRRALRSRRRRHRRAGRGAVDGRVPRRLDQDRRPRHGRNHLRPRARLFGRRPRRAARQGRRPEPRLRGHRQARRRTHALQDQHQRACLRD